MTTFQYKLKDLDLDLSRIEQRMEYRHDAGDDSISMQIIEILKEAENFTNIRAEYRIFEGVSFGEADSTLDINGLIFNINSIIYRQMSNSEAAAFFLCTAGQKISRKSRKATGEGDLVRGYIYDVIGSAVVEAAADKMQQTLQESVRSSGRNITNRFSPGYCGWDVSEQHKLFTLMTDNYCGIKLTQSALMEPLKSVSGVIGIGQDVKKIPHICNTCEMRDCIHRR